MKPITRRGFFAAIAACFIPQQKPDLWTERKEMLRARMRQIFESNECFAGYRRQLISNLALERAWQNWKLPAFVK